MRDDGSIGGRGAMHTAIARCALFRTQQARLNLLTSTLLFVVRCCSLVPIEPIMAVEIELSDAQYFGAVLADLTNQRRGVWA